MRRLFVLLSALSITLNTLGQYKVKLESGSNPFANRRLAIIADGADSKQNASLINMFQRYWKTGPSVIVQDQKELDELQKTKDYVVLRHTARISQDQRGKYRSDYLNFYTNEWESNLATFYIDAAGMASNQLYIKFFIRALENVREGRDSIDSRNFERNGDELAVLRQTTLYIPSRLLTEGNDELMKGIASSKTEIRKGTRRNITFGAYTFRYKVISDAELNELANDDTHTVCAANLVTMPDHSTGFYIYDVNAGKILYKCNQVERQINLAVIKDLNLAVMKTHLQSRL